MGLLRYGEGQEALRTNREAAVEEAEDNELVDDHLDFDADGDDGADGIERAASVAADSSSSSGEDNGAQGGGRPEGRLFFVFVWSEGRLPETVHVLYFCQLFCLCLIY